MNFNENEGYLEINAKFKDSIPVQKHLKYTDFIVQDKNPILILKFKNLSTYAFRGAKIYPFGQNQITQYGFSLVVSNGKPRNFNLGEAKASIPEIQPLETKYIELDLGYLNSGSM